jgi:uncharacterized membrane protein
MRAALVLPRHLAALRIDWLLPVAVTAVALFLYLNSAVFSSWSAVHVDLSVNLTAAHALRHGDNPYGETVLLARAKDLGSPTALIYQTLFTSYIQPPPSALSLMPLTFLPWRDASRAYLVLNNLFLVASIALTLAIVRPSLPRRWLVAGAALITAGFSQIYASFALGQVDASMTLLLLLGLWGYSRDKPAVSGAAIGVGAAIKLIPGVLILYFLWKREYRTVAWAIGVGGAILLFSFAAVGPHVYRTYLTDTLPALMKGSTQYQNISLAGVWNRLFVKDLGFLGPYLSLDEVPTSTWARLLTAASTALVLAALAFVIGRRDRREGRAEGPAKQVIVLEYYLVVAGAILISSVSWEFYVVWLLPLFLAVFLTPASVLPLDGRWRYAAIACFAAAYVGLNYPGGRVGYEYFFDSNSLFYHPDWLPAVWLEQGGHFGFSGLHLYGQHLTLVPLWRLAWLAFLALALAGILLVTRRARESAFGSGSNTQP